MTLIKEPKNIDFSKKSVPWTEQELSDFRKVMQEIKSKNRKTNKRASVVKNRKSQPLGK